MEKSKFEKLVQEGVKEIPENFRRKLSNVAIVIEDEPSREQLKKLRVSGKMNILGLYEGVPQTKRDNYGMVLPDKITVFRNPIENIASSDNEIREVVKNTVWHEIAHHFGLGEKKVRELDARRKKRK